MPKGIVTNPNGRPKGKPNHATKAAREAIALFVDNNAHRLEGWLDAIAEKDPKQAFDCFQSIIEYHIPKLARTENKHEGEVGITVNVNYPSANRPSV